MTFRQAQYPAGWNIKTLGAVSEVVNGGTPKTGVSEYWNGKHLWITPAEMGKRQSPYVENTERKLSNAGLNNSSAQLLPPNSVILSSRAPIGHLVINTKPMATNQGCKGLIPSSILYYKFLYYYLYHNVDLLNSLGTGATFKELSGGKLKEIPIPLPSLPEQKRIVAILDEAFASIATAKENAEKNLQNARELFESYLQNVFANSPSASSFVKTTEDKKATEDRPGEGWEVKKLGEVAEHSLGKMLDKNKNKGIFQKYLRNQNVRWFDFDLTDLLEMRFLEDEREKYTALKGDVLICEGGYPGRAAIWQEDYSIFFQKAIHRVRFNDISYNKWFLYYLYLSDYNGILKTYFSGTGIQHFTGEALDRFMIPLPPVKEAKRIVAKLDALSAETKKLEAIYQQKLADLEELKKSVLQKAFKGEL